MIQSNGVHAFIVWEEKILLIKRSGYKKAYPDQWDLPGGTTIDQETPEQTIYREIKEECCISQDSISDIQFIGTQQIVDENTQWYGTITFYYISLQNTSITLSHEHTAYAWVPFDKIDTYLPQRVIIGLCASLYNEHKSRA